MEWRDHMGYKPTYIGGRRRSWTFQTPDLSSFPQSRTVVIRRDKKHTVKEQNEAIRVWLDLMGIKVKSFGEAIHNGKIVSVAVLSSAKKAAIFKLAWG